MYLLLKRRKKCTLNKVIVVMVKGIQNDKKILQSSKLVTRMPGF